jgi:hypothetical protein
MGFDAVWIISVVENVDVGVVGAMNGWLKGLVAVGIMVWMG